MYTHVSLLYLLFYFACSYPTVSFDSIHPKTLNASLSAVTHFPSSPLIADIDPNFLIVIKSQGALLVNKKPVYATINKAIAELAQLDFESRILARNFRYSEIGFAQVDVTPIIPTSSLAVRYGLWGLVAVMRHLAAQVVLQELSVSLELRGLSVGQIELSKSRAGQPSPHIPTSNATTTDLGTNGTSSSISQDKSQTSEALSNMNEQLFIEHEFFGDPIETSTFHLPIAKMLLKLASFEANFRITAPDAPIIIFHEDTTIVLGEEPPHREQRPFLTKRLAVNMMSRALDEIFKDRPQVQDELSEYQVSIWEHRDPGDIEFGSMHIRKGLRTDATAVVLNTTQPVSMIMADNQSQTHYIAYPRAVEGPEAPPYRYIPGTNPVLSGLPLTIAASAVASLTPVASFLWSNGGFGCLRKISELADYEPRYDPTVIPTMGGSRTNKGNGEADDRLAYVESDDEALYTSIGDVHFAYSIGKTTPSKVIETLLALVDKEPLYKSAFLSIKRMEVIAAAKASTERFQLSQSKSILDGIPIAVKDEVDLHGHPKTFGTSKIFGSPEAQTNWCTRKWKEAGAIIVGKLNMHEYGLDTCGNNPNHGTPINPHNKAFYPGGSSSASATTVASNLLPLTLGCDGGGSIRIPSNYCGIYGLKTTHGRVSLSPSVRFAYSTGVAGPMANCIADLEVGYRFMATPDPEDKASALFAPPTMAPLRHPVESRSGKRTLAVCKAWFEAADPAVLNLCTQALDHYASLGYTIVDISIPYLHEGQIAHALTIMTEAGSTVSHPQDFSPGNQILLATFRQTQSGDFLLAQKMRNLLMQHLSWLWEQHPGMLVMSPTTPNAGWEIGKGELGCGGVSNGNMSVRNMTYVWLANFTGCPAISVPVGMAEGGAGGKGKMPVGLMAMGEWGDEGGLLEWGWVCERWVRKEGRMERPGGWSDVLGIVGGR